MSKSKREKRKPKSQRKAERGVRAKGVTQRRFNRSSTLGKPDDWWEKRLDGRDDQ